MSYSNENNLEALLAENKRLKKALADLMCWVGVSPDSLDWVSPETRQKNRDRFEAAYRNAVACFPRKERTAKFTMPADNFAN